LASCKLKPFLAAGNIKLDHCIDVDIIDYGYSTIKKLIIFYRWEWSKLSSDTVGWMFLLSSWKAWTHLGLYSQQSILNRC